MEILNTSTNCFEMVSSFATGSGSRGNPEQGKQSSIINSATLAALSLERVILGSVVLQDRDLACKRLSTYTDVNATWSRK